MDCGRQKGLGYLLSDLPRRRSAKVVKRGETKSMLMTLRKHTIDGKLKEKGPVKRKVSSDRSPLLCNGHSLVLISAALHNMSSLAIDTRAQYSGVTSRLHKHDDSSRNHWFSK